MSIIIDLFLIAIIGGTVFVGYKKGLVKVAFKVFSFLVSLCISLILFFPISNYVVKNYNFDENIQKIIISNLEKEENNKKENDTEELSILKYISKNIEDTKNKEKNEMIEIVAKEVSIKIVNISIIVMIYIITRIILIFAKGVAEAIANLPILKQCNEIGGALYGLLKALLIIYVILALIMLISSVIDLRAVVDWITNSKITSILYNNNIIIKILF